MGAICIDVAIPKVFTQKNILGMELTINNQSKFYENMPANLAALLLAEFGTLRKGIAVALNHQVIPASAWPNTPLSDKDQILIITATQGG